MDFRTHSIGQWHEALRRDQVTPEDIARHCIDRVQALDAQAHAWVRFDADRLLEAARGCGSRLAQGQPLRPLEAVPVGVKDIFNTADFPTQMGSALWAGFTPGNDARAVFNLRRAGGLVPGKTETAEFAVHTLGQTVNPWAPAHTPGTSSSGSAVAVALGMVPAALGTQTAGSIVRPASFCGVWGMKPSFGLIPRTGMLKTTDSLDTVGFFAGHACDLRRLLDGLRVHGRDFPISDKALNDRARQAAPVGRPWRVGVLRPAVVWDQVPAHARQALDAWLQRLANDGRCELLEVAAPAEMDQAHAVHATIYNRALAYYFQAEFQKAELVSPLMNQLIEDGQRITREAYAQALAQQVVLARAMDGFARGFDVLLTLSTAGGAPLRHVEERPDSALMWTLAQLPAVSAPVFRCPQGLPFGLQIVARRYNDPLLLNFIDEAVQRGLLPACGFAPAPLAMAGDAAGPGPQPGAPATAAAPEPARQSALALS